MARYEQARLTIPDDATRGVLARLHAAADRQMWSLFDITCRSCPRFCSAASCSGERMARFYDAKFIALEPAQGVFCYLTCRALGATKVVEFGTSFGVSTIYLAAAVRDNGGGQVISTEVVPAKAERARCHIAEAGLSGYVEVRDGDALQTLADVNGPIDFLLYACHHDRTTQKVPSPADMLACMCLPVFRR